MTHLTPHLSPETLGALLDGALAERARHDAEQHLESCEQCRADMAELATQDAALAKSLAHDPGDAYFESFADRVARRIDADAAPRAVRRGVWSWLVSPRGLALAGSVAALAVVTVLVTRQGHEGGAPLARPELSMRAQQSAGAPATSDQAPPPSPPVRVRAGAPGAAPVAPQATGPAGTQPFATAPAPEAPRDDAARNEAAPQAKAAAPMNAIGVRPDAREDRVAEDRIAAGHEAPRAPAAAPAQPTALQKAYQALKERSNGRLAGGSSPPSASPAPGFATEPRAMTQADVVVAWPAGAASAARQADSLSAVARATGAAADHDAAAIAWSHVRVLATGAGDAELAARGRVADERYAAWAAGATSARAASARSAVDQVLEHTPAGPARTHWEELRARLP